MPKSSSSPASLRLGIFIFLIIRELEKNKVNWMVVSSRSISLETGLDTGCGAKENRTPEVSSEEKKKLDQTVEDELDIPFTARGLD